MTLLIACLQLWQIKAPPWAYALTFGLWCWHLMHHNRFPSAKNIFDYFDKEWSKRK